MAKEQLGLFETKDLAVSIYRSFVLSRSKQNQLNGSESKDKVDCKSKEKELCMNVLSVLDGLEHSLMQRCSSDGQIIPPSSSDMFHMLGDVMEAKSIAYQLSQKLGEGYRWEE